MAADDDIRRLMLSARFLQLVRRQSRLTWGMLATVLAIYFCLMCVVAFRPDWMRVPLRDGAVLTIGWPVVAGVIVSIWVLMGLYIRRASVGFEAVKEVVLTELQP